MKGNSEDIRANFSNFKFDIRNKTFVQMDLNSKITQKVMEDFAEDEIEEEESDDLSDYEE